MGWLRVAVAVFLLTLTSYTLARRKYAAWKTAQIRACGRGKAQTRNHACQSRTARLWRTQARESVILSKCLTAMATPSALNHLRGG